MFVRDIIFNVTSVVDWRVITAKKKRQYDIDNVRESSKHVIFDYAVGDLVHGGMNGIYCKLDYNKLGL